MKTGHERNQKSLNCLFNSKQSIKSGIEFSPASGYLKHDILNICDYDRIIDTEDYDEASKRLARYLNPFNYGLNTRDELIKAIKRILIKEGGSSFDKDDYARHAYAGDIQSSRKAIKSAKYDSDTTNLRQMNIPQDLPMWLIDKYYEEERRNNNSIWHWFLQEIRRNPWKSGFTGDSLYTTDGNIDLVIGPNQARFKVYKVTPKSERIAKNLTYAYYGKDDIENIDVVIQKKDIDNFISDLLHDYIW